VDIIRVPTVRGHLRFWWRALHAHECPTAADLARRERDLWGGVGGDEGARSRVEVRVDVDRSSVREADSRVDPRQQGDEAYYALWPARATKRGEPDAPRLLPELRFQLLLLAPAERMREVEDAVRAWVLWGGYGGRTRRGLGSLTVEGDVSKWLPLGPRQDELSRVFGGLALLGAPPQGGALQMPLLRGARLCHGAPQREPERAWTQALKWLREFRQGQPPGRGKGPASRYAREWGDPRRPGRSNWPEPDKIRRLLAPDMGAPWAHPARAEYSEEAAWPRAGFGLPIPIRFQDKDRTTAKYRHPDPGEVELRWHDGKGVRERLASPLIVKAMPLADGSFVPIALWLCRAWPEGKVVLVRKGQRAPVPGSFAPFDRLLAPGDTALYAPLQAPSLPESFFRWLKSHPEVKES
jgi:CRISPR-associated protein Cmr1